jgi:hypothetical protein
MIGQYLPNNNETATVAFRQKFCQLNSPLVPKRNSKSVTVPVTSNLAAHACSTKCRRKKKLITQFSCKSRDKSFEPN